MIKPTILSLSKFDSCICRALLLVHKQKMGGGVTDTSFCVPPNLDLLVPSYYPWDLLLGAGGGDIVLIQYEVGTAWAWVTMSNDGTGRWHSPALFVMRVHIYLLDTGLEQSKRASSLSLFYTQHAAVVVGRHSSLSPSLRSMIMIGRTRQRWSYLIIMKQSLLQLLTNHP
mmetsp:Transcript_19845/g.32580  ORF Transcript_19845/g.32580 Transcript_19845/m.32580 type:complete len:170 (-) Transcript_19845:208-717(-)